MCCWTTENTIVALVYATVIGALFGLVCWLERRTRLIEQVMSVRKRLTEPQTVRWRTRVQTQTGQMVEFTSRVQLSVGTMVTADIRGELAPMGPYSRAIGHVVWQEVQLP